MNYAPFSINNKQVSVKDSVKFFYENKEEELKGERLQVFEKNKNDFLHDFFITLTNEFLKNSFSKDLLIVNELRFVEELDLVLNRLFERLYELYGLHFPESLYSLNSPELFYKFLKKGISRDLVSKNIKINKHSIGMNLNEDELRIIKKGINEFLKIFELREDGKKHVGKLVKEVMPSTYKVSGGLLAAKLLSEAGSLKSLALMPSSTIQIIGAEKALFKHLTSGTKSPKHGVLLQHVLMQKLKKNHRGRFARVLSSKISLSVKTDYFNPSDTIQGDKLRKQVMVEFNKLR